MKRLVVCSDGTWQNLSTSYPTNVAKITQAIKAVGDDGVQQLVFYGEGLGTGDKFDRITGGAFGWGIDKNIQDAYRFLCLNYEPGDQIYLFGFSRGAYTVRSLVGFIRSVGMLPREGIRCIPKAYHAYQEAKKNAKEDAKKETPLDSSQSTGQKKLRNRQEVIDFREEFKQKFPGRYHEEIEITLLGCWDTVGSLGIPDEIPWIPLDGLFNQKYQFHDTTLSSKIQYALHAVAIDENRKEFQNTAMQPADPVNWPNQVKEVWFPGGHGCVGGGTKENSPLSNAALLWMIEEVEKLGLSFDRNKIEKGISTDPSIYFGDELRPPFSKHIREIPPNANLHPSVSQRWNACSWYRPGNLHLSIKSPLASEVQLAVGDSARFVIFAEKSENETLIHLEQGGRYQITVSPCQIWQDDHIFCTAAGWRVEELEDHEVSFPGQRKLLKIAEPLRRVPTANWMQLIVTVAGASDPEQLFPIGLEGEFVAPAGGRLVAFANDVEHFYFNNKGWVFAKIARLA